MFLEPKPRRRRKSKPVKAVCVPQHCYKQEKRPLKQKQPYLRDGEQESEFLKCKFDYLFIVSIFE